MEVDIPVAHGIAMWYKLLQEGQLLCWAMLILIEQLGSPYLDVLWYVGNWLPMVIPWPDCDMCLVSLCVRQMGQFIFWFQVFQNWFSITCKLNCTHEVICIIIKSIECQEYPVDSCHFALKRAVVTGCAWCNHWAWIWLATIDPLIIQATALLSFW